VKLYGITGRIRLVSSAAVLSAAEACIRQIIDLYGKPNLSVDQIRSAFERDHFDPIKDFSVECRKELDEIAGNTCRRGRGSSSRSPLGLNNPDPVLQPVTGHG
jgi:hypothetical protein